MIKTKITQLPNLSSSQVITKPTMNKIGQLMKRQIIQRTLAGKGVKSAGGDNYIDGGQHKKGYSEAGAVVPISTEPLRKHYRSKLVGKNKGGISKGSSKARFVYLEGGYKQYRALHKRRTDIVDHTMTGRMFGGMRVAATGKRIRITFSASQMRKAYYTDELRPWFKVTLKQRGEAAGLVHDAYVKSLNKKK